MGYQIEAYLNQGRPSLRIKNMNDQAIYLDWTYQGEIEDQGSFKEIQGLFRQLLLLTCKQDLHNARLFQINPNS